MRRFLAIALAVFLILSTSAIADVDKEITFNGIPWGIGGQELIDTMSQKGFRAQRAEESSMPIWTYDFREDWKYNVADTGYYIGYYYYNDNKTKIAGYELNNIMQYAYYDIKDNKLNKPNCHYYKTEIWFDIKNELVERAYEDLKNKLTNLYGNGTESKVYLIDTDYIYTVWKGINNTAVCLYMSEDKDNNFLNLMYGITNCEETLKFVREIYINSIAPADENDYSGL